MGFHGVAFLPPKVVFTLHFLQFVVEVRALELPASCVRVVVLGEQWHAACSIVWLQEILFVVYVECHEYYKTFTNLR